MSATQQSASIPLADSGAAEDSRPGSSHFIEGVGKRIVDVVGASIALVLCAPLLLVVAVLVSLDGGPVLFRQKRIGRDGRPFACLKVRTMITDAPRCLDEYLHYNPEAREEWSRHIKLSFDPRITGIGAVLRRTSIDELPQLVNVLRGEMSLVGPRPITAQELVDVYGPAGEAYQSVKPGITGLWQISGRNDLDIKQQVALDVSYVREWSLWLDLWILVKTPAVVLSQRGAK